MDWQNIMVAAISGGIFGFGSSLVAPFVGLSIDKRKTVHAQRLALVQSVRHAAETVDRNVLNVSADYYRIRHLLSDETKSLIEASGHVLYGTYGGPHIEPWIRPLLEELASIERRWGLL